MRLLGPMAEALGDRLALALVALVCSAGFAVIGGLVVLSWTQGQTLLAAGLTAAWLAGNFPWMLVGVVIAIDVVSFLLRGKTFFVRFFSELDERSKTDPLFAHYRSEMGSFQRALVFFGGLTSPVGALVISGLLLVNRLPVDQTAVAELLQGARDRGRADSRRHAPLARPLAEVGSRFYGGIRSLAGGYS